MKQLLCKEIVFYEIPEEFGISQMIKPKTKKNDKRLAKLLKDKDDIDDDEDINLAYDNASSSSGSSSKIDIMN